MKELITISAAQISQSDNPAENAKKIFTVINQLPNTDLIVFPETALTGLYQEQDEKELQRYHDLIQLAAFRNGTGVVYGAYERINGKIANTARLIDNRGNLRFKYLKQHLWNEPDVIPGTSNQVIDTEFGKLGLIICWDIRFPETVAQLAREGADIIINPSYWFGKQFGTTQVIDKLPLVRAFESQAYFVHCDAFTENGETAARSKICSPTQVLRTAKRREEVITAQVNIAKLQRSRELFSK